MKNVDNAYPSQPLKDDPDHNGQSGCDNNQENDNDHLSKDDMYNDFIMCCWLEQYFQTESEFPNSSDKDSTGSIDHSVKTTRLARTKRGLSIKNQYHTPQT